MSKKDTTTGTEVKDLSGKPDEKKELVLETTKQEGGDPTTVSGDGDSNTEGGDPAADPAAAAVVQAPAVIPSAEPSLADPAASVAKDEIVNGRGTAVTDIMLTRINRHFDFLASRLGIPAKKDRDREQVDFMNTVGESLKLPYDQFELVADALRTALRKDIKVVSDGGVAFRFIPKLELYYPAESVACYQRYIQFLLTLTQNWKRRRDLGKMVDITAVIENFPTKARENVTAYYRKHTAA